MTKKRIGAALGLCSCAAIGMFLSLPAYGQKKGAQSHAVEQPKANTPKPTTTTVQHTSGGGQTAAGHTPANTVSGHGSTTAGSGTSHGSTTAGSGTSHGSTTAGSGTSHGSTTTSAGSGTSHGSTTAGSGTSHGSTTAGSGTSHGSTTTTAGSGTSHGSSTGTGKSFGTGGASTNTGRSFGHNASGPTPHPVESSHGSGGYSAFRNRTVPPGGHEVHTANGGHAIFDHAGNPRYVQAHGMDIHHGPGGSRTIIRESPGRVVVVSNHYGHGYIGHPYTYRNVEFVHRTYYVNGVVYSRFYRPFVWGGLSLHVYSPAAYYAPAYYGWAYHPWARPVVYAGWGWSGRPWYGYYGGWFAPYPRYAGPAFWLTDYLVSQTLMAAYQERAAELAAARMNYSEPLSPAVKDLVAAEVQRQLALANAEAAGGAAQTPPDPGSSGVARMLSDGQAHVFVVNTALDVASNSGECPVTEGDVLQLVRSIRPGAPAADLTVLATKGQDCPKGSVIQVQVADLQEMQNHMRETLDQGLAELKQQQGQGGIPAAPPAAMAAPQQTAYAAIAPPPDPNVSATLSQQTKDAAQAEQEVLRGSGQQQ